jgi:alpha-beta hydrolase superfamily lysophospholipase
MTQVAVAHHAVSGRQWAPPNEIAVRGTVVLLPGRGEHAGVYERFGRRLAADGYHVHALDGVDTESAAAAVASAPPGPVVLAGADVGALRALAFAVRGDPRLTGLLLAGVPSTGPVVGVDLGALAWVDELAARTACPTHQARLSDDSGVVRGGLATPVPAELTGIVAEPSLADLAIPVLFVHGGADVIAPLAGARTLAGRLPAAELAIVDGGRHDVLNDLHHRTVAAHVTQWLERLRTSPAAASILTVESVSYRGGTR